MLEGNGAGDLKEEAWSTAYLLLHFPSLNQSLQTPPPPCLRQISTGLRGRDDGAALFPSAPGGSLSHSIHFFLYLRYLYGLAVLGRASLPSATYSCREPARPLSWGSCLTVTRWP